MKEIREIFKFFINLALFTISCILCTGLSGYAFVYYFWNSGKVGLINWEVEYVDPRILILFSFVFFLTGCYTFFNMVTVKVE